MEILQEFLKTVSTMYCLCMCSTLALLLNVLACPALHRDQQWLRLGLSVLWVLLFTPYSFVCWYRHMCKASWRNSSFSFFVFFIRDVFCPPGDRHSRLRVQWLDLHSNGAEGQHGYSCVHAAAYLVPH